MTSSYKQKHYNRKACEDEPVKINHDYQLEPHFNPPFGSFTKEIMGGYEASVYDYPIDEIKQTEANRVLKKIISMRALHHHKSNFDRFAMAFENM